jgi:pimeloyl-ACP methyl ester carboxylesterase
MDLPGHGHSLPTNNYDLFRLSKMLVAVLDRLAIDACHMIGHSWGANLATLLAARTSRCRSLVNIEGHLVTTDLVIPELAVAAKSRGELHEWFTVSFREGAVREAARLSPACQRYYEALKLCDEDAFAEAAASLLHHIGTKARIWSRFGEEFERLLLPKLFVSGAESVMNSTLQELRKRNLQTANLDQCLHWPMIDRPDKFYSVLSAFLEQVD